MYGVLNMNGCDVTKDKKKSVGRSGSWIFSHCSVLHQKSELFTEKLFRLVANSSFFFTPKLQLQNIPVRYEKDIFSIELNDQSSK